MVVTLRFLTGRCDDIFTDIIAGFTGNCVFNQIFAVFTLQTFHFRGQFWFRVTIGDCLIFSGNGHFSLSDRNIDQIVRGVSGTKIFMVFVSLDIVLDTIFFVGISCLW